MQKRVHGWNIIIKIMIDNTYYEYNSLSKARFWNTKLIDKEIINEKE